MTDDDKAFVEACRARAYDALPFRYEDLYRLERLTGLTGCSNLDELPRDQLLPASGAVLLLCELIDGNEDYRRHCVKYLRRTRWLLAWVGIDLVVSVVLLAYTPDLWNAALLAFNGAAATFGVRHYRDLQRRRDAGLLRSLHEDAQCARRTR